MSNTKMTAIIPVRAGSTRLKGKNLYPFAGTTLLQNKIRQLKATPEVDEVLVTSDSDKMLAIAKAEGASIHKRAPEFCDEKSKTFGEVVENVCAGISSEHILWAPCTSPLVDSKTYSQAIQTYYKEVPRNGDSLVSFEVFKRFLWDENGPLNYALGVKQVPSQQLPKLYCVTCGIHIAPRAKMMEWKYCYGARPIKFILDKRRAVDVDDVFDMACARSWLDMVDVESEI